MFKFCIKTILKNPTPETELLLAEAINKDRVFILTHPEYQISLGQYCHFAYFLFLLKRGYSIAAITKHKEFYGFDFFVNKKVLIPRPDTELMVNEILNDLELSPKNILLIDVGTGSGCIPISILKNTNKIQKAIAVDISNDALKIAQKNIIKHGVQIELLKSNLLTKIFNRDFGSFEQIIITANLPYLTPQQVQSEPSIQREPKLALIASENGLALYHQLLEQIKKLFINKKILVIFEIDPTQSNQIIQLAKKYLSQNKFEIKKDLAGLDRILKIST